MAATLWWTTTVVGADPMLAAGLLKVDRCDALDLFRCFPGNCTSGFRNSEKWCRPDGQDCTNLWRCQNFRPTSWFSRRSRQLHDSQKGENAWMHCMAHQPEWNLQANLRFGEEMIGWLDLEVYRMVLSRINHFESALCDVADRSSWFRPAHKKISEIQNDSKFYCVNFHEVYLGQAQ
jgi:hypothetical protein